MNQTGQEKPHDFRQHTQREALTMGLYLAIVLLALLSEVVGIAASAAPVVGAIWGTAIGLAHVFAFRLAGKRFSAGNLTAQDRAAIMGQLSLRCPSSFSARRPAR